MKKSNCPKWPLSSKFFISDLICLSSVIGIWPRFIEPYLLSATYFELPLNRTAKASANALKIAHLSDLHFQESTKERFLAKIFQTLHHFKPDLIAITGDFICNGKLDLNSSQGNRLREFLQKLTAPLGVIAVLGNHDYQQSIGINLSGDYDTMLETVNPLYKGIASLFKSNKLTGKATENVKKLMPNQALLKIFEETKITLLNNATIQVDNRKGGALNVTGLAEHMTGQIDLKKAFQTYERGLPGIALVHNPDAFSLLKSYPSFLVLSGHTHGGQINLPWIRNRFSKLENPRYISGYFKENSQSLYVSRGLGGVFPFRFNTLPELVCITVVLS